MSDREVAQLAELGRRMEHAMDGHPQDIEWAIDGERAIYLLQARPETVWSFSA